MLEQSFSTGMQCICWQQLAHIRLVKKTLELSFSLTVLPTPSPHHKSVYTSSCKILQLLHSSMHINTYTYFLFHTDLILCIKRNQYTASVKTEMAPVFHWNTAAIESPHANHLTQKTWQTSTPAVSRVLTSTTPHWNQHSVVIIGIFSQCKKTCFHFSINQMHELPIMEHF